MHELLFQQAVWFLAGLLPREADATADPPDAVHERAPPGGAP